MSVLVIVLKHKAIDYDIDYIELADPPQWFLALSPLKKAPVLQVGDHVIFESTVINEYLDEAHPNKLHPDNLITRAYNRSWIEFGNSCTWNAFHLSVKDNEKEFNEVWQDLLEKFDAIEKVIIGTPFFNGSEFSLVDASYAPLLQRLDFLNQLRSGILDNSRHPKLCQWKNDLLSLKVVQQSSVSNIKALYEDLLWKRQGFVAQFLDKSKCRKPVESGVY